MKISDNAIRGQVEDRASELEIAIDGLDSLIDNLYAKDIIDDLKLLKIEYEEELEQLQKRKNEYAEDDLQYMNVEYERDVI